MATDLAIIIQIATLLMPLIDQIIKWIERLFPRTPGAAKKVKAMEVLKAVMPVTKGTAAELEEVSSKLIDQRVAALNEAGVFKHSKKLMS